VIHWLLFILKEIVNKILFISIEIDNIILLSSIRTFCKTVGNNIIRILLLLLLLLYVDSIVVTHKNNNNDEKNLHHVIHVTSPLFDNQPHFHGMSKIRNLLQPIPRFRKNLSSLKTQYSHGTRILFLFFKNMNHIVYIYRQ